MRAPVCLSTALGAAEMLKTVAQPPREGEHFGQKTVTYVKLGDMTPLLGRYDTLYVRPPGVRTPPPHS